MISKTDGVSIYEGLTGATQVTGDDQFIYVAAAQDNAVTMFKSPVEGVRQALNDAKEGDCLVLLALTQRDEVLEMVQSFVQDA